MTSPTISKDIATQRREVAEALRRHGSFLIVGHVRPDGDCLGSQIALGLVLQAMGKEVRVYSAGPILDHLRFIPHLDLVESQDDPAFAPEATVFCDCAGDDRAGDDVKPRGAIINIDHHVSNDHFGDAAWVDPDAAAVGEQIFDLCEDLGVSITPDIATCLYLTLLADTGSFRFANTTERTFEIATALVRRGADPGSVAAGLYDSFEPAVVKLRGEVLSALRFECEGRLCWAEITQTMYRAAGGEDAEPEGLVSDLRSIRGVEIAVLVHELAEGGARASLRSSGHWDVNGIAVALGGGGHVNASGCYVPGDYAAVRERILQAAREHLAAPPTTASR